MQMRATIGARGKIIIHTGTWSLIAKVAAAANLFIAVPFVLRALGPEEFGAWATLVSLVIFAGFLDFGFGNGTMNLVAAAQGLGNTQEIAAIVHEGQRALTKIAFVLTIVVTLALPWIPWYRLLGLPSTLANQSRWAAAAVLFSITLAVPLKLAARVQRGLGRGGIAFRWQAGGQLATLCIVILLASIGAPLHAITAAAVFTPLLAPIGNTITLLRDPAMTRPLLRRKDFSNKIRNEGIAFFVLQLAAALAYSADLPLISAMRGPTEAGTYAIVQRLFSVIPLTLGLLWAPLWPIYRNALASGSHAWVARTLRQTTLGAVCFAAVAAMAILIGFDRITSYWLHHGLTVTSFLLAGFALWAVIDAAGNSLSTFLNAASIMRYQLIVAGIFAPLCLLAKFMVLDNLDSTVMPWATAGVYATVSLLPTLLLSRQLLDAAFSKNY